MLVEEDYIETKNMLDLICPELPERLQGSVVDVPIVSIEIDELQNIWGKTTFINNFVLILVWGWGKRFCTSSKGGRGDGNCTTGAEGGNRVKV